VRRFGVLILGIALIFVGVVLDVVWTPRSSFGWTADVPLRILTVVPWIGPSLVEYAMGVVTLGLVLVAGWVGFCLGRR
jgi:hypothetical protein